MNLKKLFGLSSHKDVAAAQDPDEPRAHHYLFAHRYLPSIAFQLGITTVMILDEPEQSSRFLHDAWNNVATQYEIPLSQRIAPEALRATVRQIGEKLVAVIELPPPERVPEAHFVAIVGDTPPQLAAESQEAVDALREQCRQIPVRYLTLENGFSLDGVARTVFGEWTKEGHLNMGDGPQPTFEAFLQFLEERQIFV